MSRTPFTPSENRQPIRDAVLTMLLANSHFDAVGEYAGEQTTRAFNANQEAQAALYAAIDSEILRDRSGIPPLFTLPQIPAPAEHPLTVARRFGMVDPMAPAGQNDVLKTLLEAQGIAEQDLNRTEEDTPEAAEALERCNKAQEAVYRHIDLMLLEARNVGAATVLEASTVPKVPTTSDYVGLLEALDRYHMGGKAFESQPHPQGTEAFAQAEQEMGRVFESLTDFLNSMLFDAYWKGRRVQAEEGAPASATDSTPAPLLPASTTEAFGSVPRGCVHDMLNQTLQLLRYDELFAAAQESGAAWSKAAEANAPDTTARREVYHAARKAVRAAVVQFGAQAYLAGQEAAQ